LNDSRWRRSKTLQNASKFESRSRISKWNLNLFKWLRQYNHDNVGLCSNNQFYLTVRSSNLEHSIFEHFWKTKIPGKYKTSQFSVVNGELNKNWKKNSFQSTKIDILLNEIENHFVSVSNFFLICSFHGTDYEIPILEAGGYSNPRQLFDIFKNNIKFEIFEAKSDGKYEMKLEVLQSIIKNIYPNVEKETGNGASMSKQNDRKQYLSNIVKRINFESIDFINLPSRISLGTLQLKIVSLDKCII